jgi:hypothetical protein
LYRKATRATELQECALVGSLRKVLFLHAAVWGALGLALALIPRPFVNALSTYAVLFVGNEDIVLTDTTSVLMRLVGVQGIALAMFMVLIAQKIESTWWWSWAFVLSDTVVAIIAVLHAVVGRESFRPSWPWWLVAVVSILFAVALLWGLFKAQQEQPIIEA